MSRRVAGPSDFNSYPGEEGKDEAIKAATGRFGDKANPSRFNRYPSEIPGGVVKNPAARAHLDEILGKDPLPCPNRCGWSTLWTQDPAVSARAVKIHKIDCDEKRRLAKEKGQNPDAIAEGSAARPMPTLQDDVESIIDKKLDEKLAPVLGKVNELLEAIKVPNKKRPRKPKNAARSKSPEKKARAGGPAPVRRVERTDAAVGDPPQKPD